MCEIKRLPITRAAVLVLREAGRPLHYQVITQQLVGRNLVMSSSKRLDRTVYSDLSKHIRRMGERSWFRRTGPGCYDLTERGRTAQIRQDTRLTELIRVPLAPRDARGEYTWLEAAAIVLSEQSTALRPAEIVEKIWEQGLKPRSDRTTRYRAMGNLLAEAIRSCERSGKPAPFERVRPGYYRFVPAQGNPFDSS